MQSGVRAGLEVLNIIKPQSLSPQELKVQSSGQDCQTLQATIAFPFTIQ